MKAKTIANLDAPFTIERQRDGVCVDVFDAPDSLKETFPTYCARNDSFKGKTKLYIKRFGTKNKANHLVYLELDGFTGLFAHIASCYETAEYFIERATMVGIAANPLNRNGDRTVDKKNRIVRCLNTLSRMIGKSLIRTNRDRSYLNRSLAVIQ